MDLKGKDAKSEVKPLMQQIKERLFMLMQGVLEESEIGFLRLLVTKVLESLILISFSLHDRVSFLTATIDGFSLGAR
jgi:hypothetical protein